MTDQLRGLAGTNRRARITRRFPGDPRHNGFIDMVSESLVLIYGFHDFYPEGFSILRVADIAAVRSSEYERHWEVMLMGEGLITRPDVRAWLDLSDMRSALASIASRYAHMIVECESEESDEDDEFDIGRVVSLNSDTLEFLGFDGVGRWYSKPAEYGIDEITQVQFDTPYINIFSKYLAQPDAPA